MSVYVDDFQAKRWMGNKNGFWMFSHMIADTREELDVMAEKLNLEQRWKQCVGTRKEHFDVTENYRKRAIQEGAIVLSVRDLHQKIVERDLTAYLEGRR